MENIIIRGKITATSKKSDKRFNQENPTKAAYIETTELDGLSLEKFGLRKYTSADQNDFFIIKLSSNLVAYENESNNSTSLSELASINTPNFNTGDDEILINVVKGKNMGNEFFRVQALLLPNGISMIRTIESMNPFS